MELTGCLLLKIIKGIGLREARSLLKRINKQTMWKPKTQFLRRPSGWGIGSVFGFYQRISSYWLIYISTLKLWDMLRSPFKRIISNRRSKI